MSLARFTNDDDRPVLITGGCGFIGTNVADRLCRLGHRVRLFDNLSRAGVDRNLRWLVETHGERVDVRLGDVRDAEQMREVVEGASRVFHFAAQVAVTTSLDEPTRDFEVNALGTLNVLEAIRAQSRPPPLLFTSTNKVYGALDDVAMRTASRRYEPIDEGVRRRGIGEARPLDFHSPYGCSKGAADQYVLDYARSFGLDTVVFRMSCIYGEHQFGNEDQGWVAHFLIRALAGEPVTLYGNGLQVRDVLYVGDLVEAMLLAHEHIERLRGRAFNLGGGPSRATSLIELLDLIGELTGKRPRFRIDEWRTADQRYYVSDTSAFTTATGWKPTVDVPTGVARLAAWLQGSRSTTAVSFGERPVAP